MKTFKNKFLIFFQENFSDQNEFIEKQKAVLKQFYGKRHSENANF